MATVIARLPHSTFYLRFPLHPAGLIVNAQKSPIPLPHHCIPPCHLTDHHVDSPPPHDPSAPPLPLKVEDMREISEENLVRARHRREAARVRTEQLGI